jgi:hypothetical protein
MATGILTVADLLKQKNNSCVDYDISKIFAVIADDLKNYNSQVAEAMSAFCEKKDEQVTVFNTTTDRTFVEQDEFGIPVSKKGAAKWEVATGVRKWQTTLGWTKEYLQMKTPAELANAYNEIQIFDNKNIVRMIKQAIFNNANVTYTDNHYNAASLTLRRFWNADGSAMPANNSGTTFNGGSHTHYIARAGTLANSDVDGVLNTVLEHDQTLGVSMYINAAQIADLKGISSTKFVALGSSLMVYNATDTTQRKFDMSDLSNYCAGIWDGKIEVWVKPWVPANYILVMASGESVKPLQYRELPYESMKGIQLDSVSFAEPLVAQTATRYAGINVLNRSAGAVLYTGGTSWSNPTL